MLQNFVSIGKDVKRQFAESKLRRSVNDLKHASFSNNKSVIPKRALSARIFRGGDAAQPT
jgi:hypothetical protein